MKATAIAPANIAFVKYWGLKNPQRFIPLNASISMTLSSCLTTTTAEFSRRSRDEITILDADGNSHDVSEKDGGKNALLFEQIKRIRRLSKSTEYVRVLSRNSFPADAGIAASASGFAALTSALVEIFGLHEIQNDQKKFSRLVRQGGAVSAVRSTLGGFVEAVANKNDCYAVQLLPEKKWKICDLVAIVDRSPKKISSSHGHALATTSPYLSVRLSELPERIRMCRQAVVTKDFDALGECTEADTLSMHTVAMTSLPPVNYWKKPTMLLMEKIIHWRQEGLGVYFSVDAGANVHVLCQQKDAEKVQKLLSTLPYIQQIIYNEPAPGTHLATQHLF